MNHYDSTQVGVPFVRVRDLRITYPAANTASIVCTEEEAVRLTGDAIRSFGDIGSLTFNVLPQHMQMLVPLVDPATGQALPGNPSMSYLQIMLGILAAVRAQQLLRDEAAL